jgi:hypothetical protein
MSPRSVVGEGLPALSLALSRVRERGLCKLARLSTTFYGDFR